MLNRLKGIIKEVLNKMFNKVTIEKKLDVEIAVSDTISRAIDLWVKLYENKAPWLCENVKSLNLASAIASEMARLVTVEFESEVSGNDFINNEYKIVIDSLRNYTEYCCAKGGLVFKPYVCDEHIEVDMIQADNFFPTSYNSRGDITGAVFVDIKQEGDKQYTKLEYHNLTPEGYYISNSAYVNKNIISNRQDYSLGNQIPLDKVEEWAGLEEEVLIKNVDKPLFSYFKIPIANTIENNSPLGISIYGRAIQLIEEADKQYSRILWEYEGSELAINASADCFKRDVQGNSILPDGKERLYKSLDYGVGEFNKAIETFSPQIRDESLFNGLNKILRQIEFNVGLAYGTLSDPNETDKTAEEIKSSKQRSYQTVKDIQNSLENALDNLLYSMCVWGQLYKLCNGNYEVSYNWGDSIIIDKGKELESMRLDVASGLLRPEIYLAKKYGVSEADALKMIPDVKEEIKTNMFD